jgi:hypothetical protein
MIQKVSDNSGVSPAADLTQKAASSKTHRHTPFGDVMVDELSTPNLAGIFSGGRPTARRALSVAQPTVVASAPQAATAAATVQAASVASTAQAAVAASTPQTANTAADTPVADPSSIPTAQSVFGSQPWLAAPTGNNPDGTQFGYNPLYFATHQTAEQIAAMVGGQVVEQKVLAPNGPIQQNTPNEMIKLSNGTVVNAGLIASFYTHGYPQSYIDRMIQDEISQGQMPQGV